MSARAQVDAVSATSAASAASACASVPTASATVAVSADAIATFRVALRTVTTLLRATSPVNSSSTNRTMLDLVDLKLLELPHEVILLVFCRLDLHSLVHIAATCSRLYRDDPQRPMTLVEEALRERAMVRGYVSTLCLPEGVTSWVPHLAWLERRRDEAWAPVAARTSSSFFVEEGGRLMSCGTEYEEERVAAGVLGHGCLDNAKFIVPTPTLLPAITEIRFSSVSAGEGFNAAVSSSGNVYTWGEGEFGQLGHGDEKSSLIPKQVRAFTGHRIRSIATSAFHCIAVTEICEVFSWGLNNYGQCGNGSSGDHQLLPQRAEALAGVRARSASAGKWHSLVVTEEGTVYSFGEGSEGQLGHGTFDDRCDPAIVKALRRLRIVATAAGACHSIALTVDGMVFSWGANESAQLGLGKRVFYLNQGLPRKASLPKKVKGVLSKHKACAVVAGNDTSCALTIAGELFTWGDGYRGRLGHGDEADQLAPKRVEAFRDEWVVAVTCGNGHAVVAVRDGSVFGWGCVDGLGLPEAPAAVRDDGNCVFSPCRYQQLSCIP